MSNLADAIAELLGISPQRGDEWTILCPSPEHSDHRPSATVYVGEPMERQRGGKTVKRLPGSWYCFSCHRSGRISSDAITSYEPSTDRNLEVALANLEETERRVYPESWLSLYDYPGGVHPYWLARFLPATASLHRLGYDHERDAGTYPFRSPTGEVLGVVRRSFNVEDTGWKYRYPTGIDKSSLLYGYERVIRARVDVLVVVEGALDAVAVYEAGYLGVAIYGSRISAEQVRLINRLYPGTILLCFDNDDAGRDATEHALGSELSCPDVRVVDLGPRKDIAEYGVLGRRQVLTNALRTTET